MVEGEFDGQNEIRGFVWQEWVEDNRWRILAGLGGVLLMGMGVMWWGNTPFGGSFTNDDNRVEFLSTEISPSVSAKIVVEIGGSVMKPGVYEFENGARIQEVLMAAGGLSESADRDWVAKSINRAAKATDGMKVYIYAVDEAKTGNTVQNIGQVKGANTISSVSVNTASEAELEALWGIGPATARAIIEGRPYGSVEELLARKIIKQNVWDRNKENFTL